jgi:hypothetical protein
MARPPRANVTDWVIFFDAVDADRKSKSFVELKKLYSKSRRTKEKSLINATVRALAKELKIEYPWWARHILFLKEPYFVSGFENLKASAIQESGIEFRKNNIFVLNNFLVRV